MMPLEIAILITGPGSLIGFMVIAWGQKIKKQIQTKQGR